MASTPHSVRYSVRISKAGSRWEAVGRAHGEVFAKIRLAASMVQVSQLIDPALLVVIEADAVVP